MIGLNRRSDFGSVFIILTKGSNWWGDPSFCLPMNGISLEATQKVKKNPKTNEKEPQPLIHQKEKDTLYNV